MGLLKSVNNVLGIDYYEYRDTDYYGKYCYRVRFTIPAIRYATYEKDFEGVMRRYNTKTGWKKIRDADRDDVTENLESYKKFIEYRNTMKENKTGLIRVEHNFVSVFSNDLALLKSVEDIKPDVHYDYTQVQTHNFVGVKAFVNDPAHKYRVYFKTKMIEGSFVKQLEDLLTRTKELYPSPSLKYWVQGYQDRSTYSWRYRYTNANHFIEYDDESVLSYLALMHGEILGKRYKLIKRPEAI